MKNNLFYFQNQLLSEGGVAGHLSHIYDNYNLTFGKVKQIMDMASSGKLMGTEKTDGFNIFLTFRNGQARAARNKTDIRKGGMTLGDLMRRPFAGGDKVKSVFVEAFETFEKAVYGLDKEDVAQIFGPQGNIYYNVEIMGPAAENVINYDTFVLAIHRGGHGYFDRETGVLNPDIDVEENSEYLNSVIQKMQHAISDNRFNIQRTAMINLDKVTDDKFAIRAKKLIDSELSKYGLDDFNTIEDYLRASLTETIGASNNFDQYEHDFLSLAVDSVLGVRSLRDIPKGTPREVRKFMSQFGRSKKSARNMLKKAIWPIENIIHDFSIGVLKGLESAYILDNKAELDRLKSEVEKAIYAIQNYRGPEQEQAQDILKKQLSKIKHIDNINTVVEGFVFEFEGHLYKFTGNYAPVNQLLGLYKWGRGSVPALKPSEEDGELDEATIGMVPADAMAAPPDAPETPTSGPNGKKPAYAVIPGGYKPPHAGHYEMIKEVAEMKRASGEFLVREVYVMISPKPRTAAFGNKEIQVTAEDALAIWNIYTQNNPRIKPQISDHPSPVRATYEFMGELPPDSIMVVATSEKDKGDDRFAALQDWSDKNDLGITVKTVVVEEFGTNVSGTQMRNYIAQGDSEAFMENLPHHLSPQQQQQIWDIVSQDRSSDIQMQYEDRNNILRRERRAWGSRNGYDQLEEISQKYADIAQEFIDNADKVWGRALSFNDLFSGKNREIIEMPAEMKGDMKEIQDFLVDAGWDLDLTTGNISREFAYTIPAGPKQGEVIQKKQEISLGKFLKKLKSLGESYKQNRDKFIDVFQTAETNLVKNDSERLKFVNYVFEKYNLPTLDEMPGEWIAPRHAEEKKTKKYTLKIFSTALGLYLKDQIIERFETPYFIESIIDSYGNYNEGFLVFPRNLAWLSIFIKTWNPSLRDISDGQYRDIAKFQLALDKSFTNRNLYEDIIQFYDTVGSAFKKVRKSYDQIIDSASGNNTYASPFFSTVKHDNVLDRYLSFWNKESEKFRQNPDYGKENKYSIILSRHPIDVLRMSDFEAINSCHTEPGKFGREGEYFKCAVAESQGHGLVAYIVENDQLSRFLEEREGEWDDLRSDFQLGEIFTDRDRGVNGITPLSRLRVRKYVKKQDITTEPQSVPITKGTIRAQYPLSQLTYKDIDNYTETFGSHTLAQGMVQLEGTLVRADWYQSEEQIVYVLENVYAYGPDEKEGKIEILDLDKQGVWLLGKYVKNYEEVDGKVHFEEKDKEKPSYELAVPETSRYGKNIPYFYDTLKDWLYDNQITKILQNEGYADENEFEERKLETKHFRRYGGSYSDTSSGKLFRDFFDDEWYSKYGRRYGHDVTDDIEYEDDLFGPDMERELDRLVDNCNYIISDFDHVGAHIDYEFYGHNDYYVSLQVSTHVSFDIMSKMLQTEDFTTKFPSNRANYSARRIFLDAISDVLDDYYIWGDLDYDLSSSSGDEFNLWITPEIHPNIPDEYYDFVRSTLKDFDAAFEEFIMDLCEKLIEEEYIILDEKPLDDNAFTKFIATLPLQHFEIEKQGISYKFKKHLYLGDILYMPDDVGVTSPLSDRNRDTYFQKFLIYTFHAFLGKINQINQKQGRLNLQEAVSGEKDVQINFNLVSGWNKIEPEKEKIDTPNYQFLRRANKVLPHVYDYVGGRDKVKINFSNNETFEISNKPPKTKPLMGTLTFELDFSSFNKSPDWVRSVLKFLIWLDKTDFKEFRNICHKYVQFINATMIKELQDKFIPSFEKDLKELYAKIKVTSLDDPRVGEITVSINELLDDQWFRAKYALYENFKNINISDQNLTMSKAEILDAITYLKEKPTTLTSDETIKQMTHNIELSEQLHEGYYDIEKGMSIEEIHRKWLNGNKAYGGITYFPLDEVAKYKEYEWTPQKFRAMNHDPEAYQRLEQSMLENGWKKEEPAKIFLGKNGCGKLGEGNHRLSIALRHPQKFKQVPVQFFFWRNITSDYGKAHCIEELSEDNLTGGLADFRNPNEFDQEQLKKGAKVEFEHTNDLKTAIEIAMDHLVEDPNYYDKLEKIHVDEVSAAGGGAVMGAPNDEWLKKKEYTFEGVASDV